MTTIEILTYSAGAFGILAIAAILIAIGSWLEGRRQQIKYWTLE